MRTHRSSRPSKMGILEKPISEVKSMIKKMPFVGDDQCSECGYETHDASKFNTYAASNAGELTHDNEVPEEYYGDFNMEQFNSNDKTGQEDYEFVQQGDYNFNDSSIPMATAEELLLIEANEKKSTRQSRSASPRKTPKLKPSARSAPHYLENMADASAAHHLDNFADASATHHLDFADASATENVASNNFADACAACEEEYLPYEPECAPCEQECAPCEPVCAPCEPVCAPCEPVCKPRYKMVKRTKTCYRTVKCPKKVKTRKTIRVPKCINTHRVVEKQECVPFQRNVWRKQTVTVQRRRKRQITEPSTKTIMVPKEVCGYKYETRCKKVLCDPCEPVCEPCAPVCKPCGPSRKQCASDPKFLSSFKNMFRSSKNRKCN